MTPVFCLLLFGVLEFGLTFRDYLTVANASRDGARADTKALYRSDDPGWSGLTDVDFRVGRFGQLEFTHDGDRCTFEVLLDRAGLDDPALRQIGEIVHDIDVKDGKFDRPEAAGIAQVIAGIAMANDDDEARLARSAVIFDDLLTYFRRKRRPAAKAGRKEKPQ